MRWRCLALIVCLVASPALGQTCETLAPTGPGSFSNNTPINCAANWQCVLTNDGDTTIISGTETAQRYDTYATANTTLTAIGSVEVHVVSRLVAIGGNSVAPTVFTHSNTYTK